MTRILIAFMACLIFSVAGNAKSAENLKNDGDHPGDHGSHRKKGGHRKGFRLFHRHHSHGKNHRSRHHRHDRYKHDFDEVSW